MPTEQFYFGPDIQDLLLACMARKRIEFMVLAPLVKPNFMWGTSAMRVAAAMQDYRAEYGNYPGLTAVDGYLHEKYGREKKDLYNEAHDYIEKLKRIDIADWKLVKNLTLKFCKQRAIVFAIKKAADMIKTNEVPPGGFSKMFDEAMQLGSDTGFEDATKLLSAELPQDQPLVCGLFDAGDIALIGGSSKTFKSWLLIMLAVAVATGTDWLGLKVNRAKVCLVNFELKKTTLQSRLRAVCEALEVNLEPGWLHLKTMRGLPPEQLNTALEWLVPEIKATGAKLVIIDPLYQVNVGKSEREEDAVSTLMASLGSMASRTNAAVVACQHFSKGNQSGKEMLDRFSGSGVFGRYVDCAITMTRHEAEGAYVVEIKPRAYPEPEPFVVRWKSPLLVRDDALDPAKLKKRDASNVNGEQYQDAELLGLITEGMTQREWSAKAVRNLGMDKSTFSRRKTKLVDSGKVTILDGKVFIPER